MFGWMEETLNYINLVKANIRVSIGTQLDLLIPIKEKAED